LPNAGIKAERGKRRDGRVKSIVPGSSGVTPADKIAMSGENDRILGNLPRSRPGVRSDKRPSGKRSGGAGATSSAPPAPKAKPSTKPKVSAAAKPKAGARANAAARQAPPAQHSADPITLAVKTAGTVAETGLKVASRVAGEVLRRLPRP
jgi:hypothetical protein